MKYKSVPGTRDIIPPDSKKVLKAEQIIREVFNLYSYDEIRTPIFEETQLFKRSIGENTDIVGKEMYTFLDKGGSSLTLRPELTASVLRSYIQHNIGEQANLARLYYIGAAFRQERPQAGRLRQFHQFGAEALGAVNPTIDAELISMVLDIYSKFGITEYNVKINSIGCPECRIKYKNILTEILQKKINFLSDESKNRLKTNPLRILDSKDEKDKKAVEDVPLLLDYLCDTCADHFKGVKNNLDILGIKYIVDGKIVRGLDYYTKTAFEITSSNIGSQDALAGGGRYDLLIEELGGKPTPGVGWAAGLERLLLILENTGKSIILDDEKIIYIAVVDDESRNIALKYAKLIRNEGFKTDLDFNNRSLKAQFRDANKKDAKIVLIISRDEIKENKITLKNMVSGEQSIVNVDDIFIEIKKII